MNMNCDIKNSEVLNMLDVENSTWLNMIVNMAVIISNYYSSASDERKKLKISWKSLINYF